LLNSAHVGIAAAEQNIIQDGLPRPGTLDGTVDIVNLGI
jgi:hypothetical protein